VNDKVQFTCRKQILSTDVKHERGEKVKEAGDGVESGFPLWEQKLYWRLNDHKIQYGKFFFTSHFIILFEIVLKQRKSSERNRLKIN